MNDLIDTELVWMIFTIFKLAIAEVLSFTAFYIVLSKLLGPNRKVTSAVVSSCLSVFCFQKVAEILNHLSEYVSLASLGVFSLAVIHEAYKRRQME
jgi:hypothetical protein